MELTLEVLVDLAGPLEDGSRASQKLREKLEEDADLPDVESLLDEALDGTDSYHNRALQDIMNNLGQRLGFEVEYGAYKPGSDTIGYDGLWSSTDVGDRETRLVVETKKSTNYTIDPENQPGAYMDAIVERDGLDNEQVHGLIIVGDDRNLNTVVQSIRGSLYRNRIRVITCDQLFELLAMADRSGLRHKQVAQVLLPMDAVNVGSIVGLMNRIMEESRGDPPTTNEDGPESDGVAVNRFWTRCRQEAGVE